MSDSDGMFKDDRSRQRRERGQTAQGGDEDEDEDEGKAWDESENELAGSSRVNQDRMPPTVSPKQPGFL